MGACGQAAISETIFEAGVVGEEEDVTRAACTAKVLHFRVRGQ